MKKPFILMLYGVALFWILREYYKDPANLGMPRPKVLAAPTYLYGILALASDFTAGFTIPLAAGLTLSLIWQTNAKNTPAKPLKGVTSVTPGPSSPKPGGSQAGKRVTPTQHNQG
jgi:hypothetical protein